MCILNSHMSDVSEFLWSIGVFVTCDFNTNNNDRVLASASLGLWGFLGQTHTFLLFSC